MTVERARDPHPPREAPGTVEARSVLASFEAEQRFARPYEHRMASPFAGASHIETVVHSVNEKHIRVALLTQEYPRALGQAGTSVTREVARAPRYASVSTIRDTRGIAPAGPS